MKRRKEDEAADGPKVKRAKAMQACASCRKSKTRCELIDGQRAGLTPQPCHRCTTMHTQCSFEADIQQNGIDKLKASSLPQRPSSSSSLFLPAEKRIELDESSQIMTCERDDLVDSLSARWIRQDGRSSAPDWVATPMLSIREVIAKYTRPHQPPALSSTSDQSIQDILANEQVDWLLDVFHKNYAPWIPLRSEKSTALLNLARCTVTSRHMDRETRLILAPRLEALTERILLQQIFIPSVELLHVMFILSLWSPICVGATAAATRDTRLLIASGVNLAMGLSLGKAAQRFGTLKEKADSPLHELDEAADGARLWIALANVESMLCFGTGRTPLSTRGQADIELISVHSTPFTAARKPIPPLSVYDISQFSSQSSLNDSRDVRLGILAYLYNIVEAGLKLKLTVISEFDKFRSEVDNVLNELSSHFHIISSLHLISAHESPHFKMLNFEFYHCQLMFIMHIIHQSRSILRPHFSSKLWPHATHKGELIFATWAKIEVISAETMFSCIISLPSAFVATAPDIFFSMIMFAAYALILTKSSIWDMTQQYLGGFSDELLLLVIDKLREAALSEDHAPASCARILKILSDSWHNHIKKSTGGTNGSNAQNGEATNKQPQPSPPLNPSFNEYRRKQHHDIYSSYDSPSTSSDMSSQSTHISPPVLSFHPLPLDPQYNGTPAEAFTSFDSRETDNVAGDFWTSFMENLAESGPAAFGYPMLQ